MFCDLVGFTPLSEARDPEEVRELLSRYFDAASTVIHRYGGVVEKFIGDAVMAVWGTPVATEGDAERAVRAALDLMDSVHLLGIETGLDGLAARAGVVTGEVAVTIGATNEGMVAGDAVNTAARVQSAASAGQVLVDATTRRLSSSAIAFDDAAEFTLKGKAEREPLWRATCVLSGLGGSQRVDGLEASLTGRDAEMRTVRELFHAAADRRTSRLILIAGPPGVGKSRLGWEFEKYVDGLADTVRWHRGRCLSYGEGVAFWALAEIVRQRMGIAEDDLPETAAAKLEQGLTTYLKDVEERAYVGTRLARLLGVAFAGELGGELSREELFAGWRLFFERLAATNAVVLMVEDAHHADPGLLDFLDHLVDWSRDLPICVLVVARPELEEVRPGFGTGRNRVVLTLDPLDDASMVALADALVPGMPASARDAIVGQAQGIPLFAVETVRSLIDRDVVQPVDGVYRLVGDVGKLVVPDSLHSLLAARLDALDPLARRLVADAAVLGTTFPEDAVLAVSGLDRATVQEGLAVLLRREVLAISADRLSPEQGSYRFAQEMLRQVAYETLSRRDRKARHLAVAAHLQTALPREGEEVVDVVARHYLDALAAVPGDDDTGEIRELAVAALSRAAERAERTGAPARAASSYATAAELLDGDVDAVRVARLWELAAKACMRSGDGHRTIGLAEQAVDRYVALDEKRAAARTKTVLAKALRRSGRHSDAREVMSEALDVLREDPDIDTVRALGELAALENFGGTPAADEVTTEQLRLAEGLAVGADLMAQAFMGRGIYFTAIARNAEAAVYFREAARLGEESTRVDIIGLALLNLSNSVAITDPAAAAEVSRRALDPLRRAGDRYSMAIGLLNLAEALLEIGDWDEAADLLAPGGEADNLGEVMEPVRVAQGILAGLRGDQAWAESITASFTFLRGSEDQTERAAVATVETLAAAAAGRYEQVLQHVAGVLSATDAMGISSDFIRWVWPVAARAAVDLGRPETVADLLAMLDSELPGRLAPLLRAERDLVRARIAVLNGDADAGARLGAAVESMRGMSPPHLLAGGLLDLAEHLGSVGDPAAALALEEARTIGERLGCRPLLDRAGRLASGQPVTI